ncbi:MAG: CDP-glucose 4,6-dehydratase [Synergistaceae bacterium]|nr:CDP-glucose 4,6-dehydratase [Synergistaceae bacterium]
MAVIKNFYRNKRVFITGHTGFKGSWLCEVLLNLGAEVGGYALSPEKDTPNLFGILNLSGRITSHFTGDIRDSESLKSAVKSFMPEIVIHMAAQPLVLESYRNPAYTYEVNVMGTVNILEAVRECKSVKSFVNVTTDKVYLNREWVYGYRENERLCGYDPYSNSKSCSELVTYSYRNSFFGDSDSPAISTARSGNVIGGGDFALNRIIPDCMRSVLNGEDIVLRNPYSVRPYQHVLECLNGYLLLAMKQYQDKAAYEGSYNFGPDENSCVTTQTLAELFCEAYGGKIRTVIQDSQTPKPHEANMLKLDCSKSKAVLGWRPEWRISQAVEEAANWLKVYAAHENICSYMDGVISQRIW